MQNFEKIVGVAALDVLPRLGEKALRILTPFATAYLCDKRDPKADLQISFNKKVQRFEKIMGEKQEQRSHWG